MQPQQIKPNKRENPTINKINKKLNQKTKEVGITIANKPIAKVYNGTIS